VIELISFIVVILIAWQIIKLLNREPTIEEARTKGVEKVKPHLKDPILVEDYAESKGISKAEVDALIGQGKIPAYSWHQYTYVENTDAT
jgi:hypothetical protein